MDNLCARIERNRRWRARREQSAGEEKEGNDDDDEGEEEKDEKDEKEKRKRKNKEWRERRSTSNSQVIFSHSQLSSLCLSNIFSEQRAIFKENLPNQKLFPSRLI